MAKHRADGEPDSAPQGGSEKSGLENAAESFAENVADQVPDGVGNNPRDTADEAEDPRTETHSSISEGSNARESRDDPTR